jgi:signal transduction histidine kinase
LSDEPFRRIVETAAEGIWTIDAEAKTSFVNPKLTQLLGYTAEEMHNRSLFDFMDGEWRLAAQANLGRRQGGISEAWLATSPIHDETGKYVGALAMVRDVTEGRRAAEELRVAEARFRSLFEHSPNVLWEEDLSDFKHYIDELRRSGVTDIRAYLESRPDEVRLCLAKVRVLDVNQAALRLYEAPDKAALLTGLGRILTPDSFKVLTQELIALAEGQTLFESEATNQSFSGQKNHVLLKALVAPGCEHSLSRVYVSIVDITARKQLEEQLRHSQKMDAIGQLAGGIAHDLNNLLTVIHGNASLLEVRDTLPSEKVEALEGITQATERAAALIRQLLTFSRRQVLQRRRLDLNEVVRSLAKLLDRILGADIRLELDLDAGPLFTRADPSMLDQVLMNLVVNARDAMATGGELRIETSRAAVTDVDRLRFPDIGLGPHVCVRVTDTGCGIPPESLPHVFEPFFTTKADGKGTGLGLATVFGIVKQHGGALRITSTLGRGTSLSVLLPEFGDESSELAPRARKVPQPARGGSEHILLVEDEEPVRRLVKRLLEGQGYRVSVAASGAEALELWFAAGDSFDLLLTDMVMPGGISGPELANRLLELRPRLKVLFTSGYPGNIAGKGLELRAGVNFLQKPFLPLALFDCVRSRLDAP